MFDLLFEGFMKLMKTVTVFSATLITSLASGTFSQPALFGSVAIARERGGLPPGERPSEAVHSLFESVRLAKSDTELEADREAIRRFFVRQPTSVSNSDTAGVGTASSSHVTQ